MDRDLEKSRSNLFTFFSLDDSEYGIEVKHVEEIVQKIEIHDVPGAEDIILGAANFRGDVIPVIDIKASLGIGNVDDDWKKVLLIKYSGKRYALPVDEVDNLVQVKDEDFVDPEKITNLDRDAIKWIVSQGKRTVRILNISKLLERMLDEEELKGEGFVEDGA